jgi:hypothetical protein
VKFEFEGKDVKRVEVAPQIPTKGVPAPCKDMHSSQLNLGTEDVMLSELLDLSVPLGIKYMSRYMDTLCRMKGVTLNDVVFEKYNGQCIDTKEARIIAWGGKSLFLKLFAFLCVGFLFLSFNIQTHGLLPSLQQVVPANSISPFLSYLAIIHES